MFTRSFTAPALVSVTTAPETASGLPWKIIRSKAGDTTQGGGKSALRIGRINDTSYENL